jgi:hypothetical protein
MYAMFIKSGTHSEARTAAATALAVAVLLAGYAQSCLAQQQPRTFSSAEEASLALFLAVQSRDEDAVMDILGAGRELVSTGDDVQDGLEHEKFAQKYKEMHRLVREPDKTTVLYVGAENWPFPVPLVARHGRWCFDSQSGANEVLFRRIGENESTTIGMFRLLVLAQEEYQRRSDEYTMHFVGGKGTHNGLNWMGDSAIPEPLVRAAVDDQAARDHSAVPFHGYYFRILSAQGKHAPGGAKSYISNGKMISGFAFVAYPAEYRSSGVKTFIAGSDGTVYEKDLGPQTAKIAGSMTTYDPGPGWHAAEQYPGEALL